MLIGYARVSTEDQNLDLQVDALTKAGCEKIFNYKDSRTSFNRPGLVEALEYLREGDTLVIWKLERLGGKTKNLLEPFDYLRQRNINLKSIKDSIDTGSAIGKLFFHFSSALAAFEIDVLRERTQAGLAAARGRLGGRPKALNESQKQQALDLYYSKKHTVNSICETLNISKGTFYNYLKQEKCLTGKGNPLRGNDTVATVLNTFYKYRVASHFSWCLTNALITVNSLRIHAIKATFFALPLATNRS